MEGTGHARATRDGVALFGDNGLLLAVQGGTEDVPGEGRALDGHGEFLLSTIGYCLHSGAGHCVLGVVCVSVHRPPSKALAGK